MCCRDIHHWAGDRLVTFKSRLLTTAFLAAALSSTGAHAANLITNGDFEAGALGNTVPGWVIDAAVDPLSIYVLNGAAYGPCCGANGSAAALANKFVTFGTGDSQNNPARILQDFTLAAGRNRITFDFGAIGGAPHQLSFGIYDFTVGAFLLIDTVSANPSNNFDTLFQTYTADFVSGGGLGNLQFTSFDGTTSKDIFLDNVSVTGVPEAASWALMIAGFGLVGGALRRRNKVSVTYA